jgi:hypothetical protein
MTGLFHKGRSTSLSLIAPAAFAAGANNYSQHNLVADTAGVRRQHDT